MGSTPQDSKPAREPSTRKRGPTSGATALIQRCESAPPCLEKCARLLGVARRWRRDDGKLEAEVAGPVEEGGQVRDDLGSRKVGAHLVGALGTARDDGDEVEVRVGGDEGGVEVASTHAVADERCTDPHGPTLPRA